MERFAFEGYPGVDSACGLAIQPQADGTLFVILSELPDNPGTSVTNACEYIAAELLETRDEIKSAAAVRWFEHTPQQLERRPVSRRPETFDEITFGPGAWASLLLMDKTPRVGPFFHGRRSLGQPSWRRVLDPALRARLQTMMGERA